MGLFDEPEEKKEEPKAEVEEKPTEPEGKKPGFFKRIDNKLKKMGDEYKANAPERLKKRKEKLQNKIAIQREKNTLNKLRLENVKTRSNISTIRNKALGEFPDPFSNNIDSDIEPKKKTKKKQEQSKTKTKQIKFTIGV